ncbi:hypothetical protein EVAR_62524_1 [Eumeta japonica]|uniref:Uncharacterized protein n=1 Tax=Eumeta variegata TaxID=151549 RepID=A0A4C1ZE26_EUMVA|nr:hypothetical protein EVAR_62524_1 [Eumeta japonica]
MEARDPVPSAESGPFPSRSNDLGARRRHASRAVSETRFAHTWHAAEIASQINTRGHCFDNAMGTLTCVITFKNEKIVLGLASRPPARGASPSSRLL